MKWSALLACMLLFSAAAAATADVPPPPERQKKALAKDYVVRIVPLERAARAWIELPKSIANGKKADATSESPLRTVMAGLFLSLALVGGGLWAARRKQGVSALGAVAFGATAALAGGVAWANIAPPRFVTPEVSVVWSEGREIRLHINPIQLENLTESYQQMNTGLKLKAPGSAAPSGSGGATPR